MLEDKGLFKLLYIQHIIVIQSQNHIYQISHNAPVPSLSVWALHQFFSLQSQLHYRWRMRKEPSLLSLLLYLTVAGHFVSLLALICPDQCELSCTWLTGLQFQHCSAVFSSQIDTIPPDSRLNLIRSLWYLTGSGKPEKTLSRSSQKSGVNTLLIVKKHIDSGLNNGVEDSL